MLTEDVKFLEPKDRERVLDGEREVVAGFARAVAALRPDLRRRGAAKPLTMLLFGMINWMFTWMQPDGALTMRRWRRSSPTCSSAACGRCSCRASRRHGTGSTAEPAHGRARVRAEPPERLSFRTTTGDIP